MLVITFNDVLVAESRAVCLDAICFSLLIHVVLRFSSFPCGMRSSEDDGLDHFFLGSHKMRKPIASCCVVCVSQV